MEIVKSSVNVEKNFNKPRQMDCLDSLELESEEILRPSMRLIVHQKDSLIDSELMNVTTNEVDSTIIDASNA